MRFPEILVYIGALVLLIFANIEPGAATFGFENDKVNHFLAFAVFSVLSKSAFPRVEVRFILLALLMFNAAIEVTQGLLNNGRQPDVLDWVAGACATIMVLFLMSLMGRGDPA